MTTPSTPCCNFCRDTIRGRAFCNDSSCPCHISTTEKEDLGEGMYAGKKLKDMTREELYSALANHDRLYRTALTQNHE